MRSALKAHGVDLDQPYDELCWILEHLVHAGLVMPFDKFLPPELMDLATQCLLGYDARYPA